MKSADLLTALFTPVEVQERRGQLEATARLDRVPRDAPFESQTPVLYAQLATLGFELGEPIDDCFLAVTAPVGWQFRPTDHAMWSDLLDPRGSVRGAMFYKAAWYDRKAHLSLARRYAIKTQYHGHDDDTYNADALVSRSGVWDAETRTWLYTTAWITRPETPVLKTSAIKTVWVDDDGREVEPPPHMPRDVSNMYEHGFYRSREPARRLHRKTIAVATPAEQAAYDAAREHARNAQRAVWAAEEAAQTELRAWLSTYYPDPSPLAYWTPYSEPKLE